MMSLSSDELLFYVNGVKISDLNVDPRWSLARYLREKLRLTGTKIGCSEGGCGACTVMVSKLDLKDRKPYHFAINSCLTPVCSMHLLAVTTVEGIGSSRSRIHPVQERLAKAHGSQCGFCSPGIVMSMYTLLRNHPNPSMKQIEEALVGNLCRCTGYRPILEGFRTFSNEASGIGCGKKDCCQLSNGTVDSKSMSNINLKEKTSIYEGQIDKTPVLFNSQDFEAYDPEQEIIFPPELKKIYSNSINNSVVFRSSSVTYYRPTSIDEIVQLRNDHPDAKIIIGNTEVGIEMIFKNAEYPVLINPMNVSELIKISHNESSLQIGPAAPFSEIENYIRTKILEKNDVLVALLDMLQLFASRQIRNVAALGGNIMTSSPISDLNPILVACKATLTFRSIDGTRQVTMDENFFTSYRSNIAKPNEVLVGINIPFTHEDEYISSYKQSRRRDDDIAIVNAALRVRFVPQSLRVESASLVYGGMAATLVVAKNTMQFMVGKDWNEELLESSLSKILEELQLSPSAPGGMVEYRQALAASFVFKFYLEVRQKLLEKFPLLFHTKSDELNWKDQQDHVLPTTSTQFFQNVPKDQCKIDPVGHPVPHASCIQQVTGEAIFVGDMTPLKGELFAAFVNSTKCYAKIKHIDASQALTIEGVEAFFSAEDITRDRNMYQIVTKLDEEVFASSVVTAVGQSIGVILAEDPVVAKKAANKVTVTYEDLPDPNITIQDAINAKSFLSDPIILENGDLVKGFEDSAHILKGESYIGGQEHFYLETQSSIVIPNEDGEMTVFCATQCPNLIQANVAKTLGVDRNRVVCRTKRLGGGFGGKESRCLQSLLPAAIAASKLNRPVRTVLDRMEDMETTGGRHPFYSKWKIGLTREGKFKALELELYSNGGNSLDLSYAVLTRAILGCDNAYKFENIKVTGRICKTNTRSNTAFRGFGQPQLVFIVEEIITKAAELLGLEQNTIRVLNFYTLGDVTCLNRPMNENKILACWKQVVEMSDYEKRNMAVEAYNRQNKLRKRGLSIIPTKFGVAFDVPFLNQGGALVQVYLDGSVLITHGGVEMGQGLHTKMIQVASRVLNIPISKIHISETATDKVPNSSATVASMGSDLSGPAVMDACKKIIERLSPYKEKNPDGTWNEFVNAAYFDRVSLSATGYYLTPGLSQYCYKTNTGSVFRYFSYGSAVTEVEIDCLTGDHTVIRTDIVMDVGTSLNPAIDIGQIEGAFMQGLGLVTMEELRFSPEGDLLTKGPGSYKIPTVQDIPKSFNVALLRDSSNPRAIYSSKAVGEPPLCLAISVFFAIREAIKATLAPEEVAHLQLSSPATAEKIRMACKDHITRQIKTYDKLSFKPWSIEI